MSTLDRVMSQVDEMFTWLDDDTPHITSVVEVSHKTMRALLQDMNATVRHTVGFNRIQFQNRHGTFDVYPSKEVDDDDIVLSDIDGSRYSYKDAYVNDVIEKTILG